MAQAVKRLKADDARRLKELGTENTLLKRIVADEELEIKPCPCGGNWND
jgi:hypothetical protein